MTREQVNALRAAGIEDKTIIDLIISETAEAVAPKPEPAKPEPTEQEPENPEPTAAPDPVPAASDREDKILAAIEKLTGAIYNHNVFGTGSEDVKEESAADIIGKALRQN